MPLPLLPATALSILLAGLVAPIAGAAQDRDVPPASATLSEQTTTRIVTAVAEAIRGEYVFPDKADAIAARLLQNFDAGRYARLKPGALAERMSEDLRAASHDGHLYLRWDPVQYAAMMQPAPTPARDPATQPAPRVAAADDEESPSAYERAMAVRSHHGLAELRVLPGNLRYLRISGFEWADAATRAAYDDALRFLREGDAIVIDLRGNGGGSPLPVRYLVSHFLDAGVLLYDFTERGKPPRPSRTLAVPPADRIRDTPLYVLVDGGTASAAEDFAYQVSQYRLGRIVGDTTAGAANNNMLLPISDGLILSVSHGRPVHPLSHGNWEGTGIRPDLPAAAVDALAVAEGDALETLLTTHAHDADRVADYRWAQVDIDALRRPPTVSDAQRAAWAGRYGEVRVAVRDGALWLSRPDRPTRRLRPLTADGLFAVEFTDGLRVRFQPKALALLRSGDPDPGIHDKD